MPTRKLSLSRENSPARRVSCKVSIPSFSRLFKDARPRDGGLRFRGKSLPVANRRTLVRKRWRENVRAKGYVHIVSASLSLSLTHFGRRRFVCRYCYRASTRGRLSPFSISISLSGARRELLLWLVAWRHVDGCWLCSGMWKS